MFEQYTSENEEIDNDLLMRKIAGGAGWFYWIAGLSIVNSLATYFEAQWNFAIGLGVTQIIDALGLYTRQDGSAATISGALLVLSIIVACLFGVLGVFAGKSLQWAFFLGIAVYILDSLLMLAFGDVLGIIIHAIALFFLFRGLLAARKMNAPQVPQL